MTGAESTGFIGWTATYGQVIGFYIQITYYVVLAVASFWAAKTFASYVKYMTTEDVEVEETEYVEDVSESAESDEKKSVDEFVE